MRIINKLKSGSIKAVKVLVVFFIIQLVIVSMLVYIIKSASIERYHFYETTLVVDKIEYQYKMFTRHPVVSIYSDGIEYGFVIIPVINTKEYSMYELYKTIDEGDKLFISYIKKRSSNVIIGASLNNEVLRSKLGYERFLKEQKVCGIVVCGVLELIYVIVLWFFIMLYRNKIRSMIKNLKKVLSMRKEKTFENKRL